MPDVPAGVVLIIPGDQSILEHRRPRRHLLGFRSQSPILDSIRELDLKVKDRSRERPIKPRAVTAVRHQDLLTEPTGCGPARRQGRPAARAGTDAMRRVRGRVEDGRSGGRGLRPAESRAPGRPGRGRTPPGRRPRAGRAWAARPRSASRRHPVLGAGRPRPEAMPVGRSDRAGWLAVSGGPGDFAGSAFVVPRSGWVPLRFPVGSLPGHGRRR